MYCPSSMLVRIQQDLCLCEDTEVYLWFAGAARQQGMDHLQTMSASLDGVAILLRLRMSCSHVVLCA
jgi:hypothetical protein